MYIEELKDYEEKTACGGIEAASGKSNGVVVAVAAKRVLIGAGGRVLFYPTLLYNVVRHRIQPEFRWWDRVAEYILLGAVPFPGDVLCLKELGVRGVVTLNEPYETLVPTALYKAHGIDHLVIPTRDYCFAPSLSNICQAVEFLHEKASCGKMTYVHCKAGRGRSTTVVICYLVKHKDMIPEAAYDYVKSIRPRVLLASSQWLAVQEFYHIYVKQGGICRGLSTKVPTGAACSRGEVSFDDDCVVVVTESDLVGYNPCVNCDHDRREIWADLRVVYRVRFAGQAAMARISCLWMRYRENRKLAGEKILYAEEGKCGMRCSYVEGINVDIHVY